MWVKHVVLFYYRFIGEESSAEGTSCVFTDDPTWIIDPIDGTTNFVHRLYNLHFILSLVISSIMFLF